MDVIVTWEDKTKNCVSITELKPAKKNGKLDLGCRVKMRYDSKWYFGIITSIENLRSGRIKTLKSDKILSDVSDSETTVIVTWEDKTKNCVNISELKPAKKNGKLDLGCRVKMLYDSKWYFGIITATENPQTGEIKALEPENNLSDKLNSESSDDNTPLSSFVDKNHEILSGSNVNIPERHHSIGDYNTPNTKRLTFSGLPSPNDVGHGHLQELTSSTVIQNLQESIAVTVEPIDNTAKRNLSCDIHPNVTSNSDNCETASGSSVKIPDKNDSFGDSITHHSEKNELTDICIPSPNYNVNDQLQRLTALQESITVTGEEATNMSAKGNFSRDHFQVEFLTNNDSNMTYCSTDHSNNLEAVENMDVYDDDNDPDYVPGRVESPTILQITQETNTTVVNIPMIQSCEVPACLGRIYESCNRCFKFLCLEHFKDKVACNEHGKLNTNEKESIQVHKSSTISLQSVSKSTTINNNDQYISQRCAVPDCFGHVFSACVNCNSLLCWSHFDGDLRFVSCESHKNDCAIPISTSPVNVENLNLFDLYPEPEHDNFIIPNATSAGNVENSTVIETSYQVEGSRREFNLDQPKKVNKRKLAQSLRNTGQEYICNKTKKVMPAKTIGAFCNVINCQLNSRDCYLFNDIDRKVIFADFYSTGETFLKRDYISRHVTEHNVKQRTVRSGDKISRRNRSLKYYLTLNGKKHRVCRTFFLNTLSISEKFVRNTLKMPNQSGVIVRREARGGRVESLKDRDSRINDTIKEHINRYPRVESHYCRENSTKEYLNSQLSVKKMHQMLLDELKLKDTPPMDTPSLTTYKKVFKSMNLGFNRPKKDQCSLCAAYYEGSPETKLTLKEKYDKHSAEKTLVRSLKDEDKKEALSTNTKKICASFDLQQVIYLPTTNEGAIFYKRQLSVYNFTVYNIANRDCYCFTWPETESRRGSSEISTAVSIFINEHDVPSCNSMSLYADGCAGQNKNSIIASALLHCINNTANIQTITLRYFAPSHGQNEGDSAHSAVNYAIKKAGDMFLPCQLYPIIQKARSGHPYNVRPLQYMDFKDFKLLSKQTNLLKIRKDNETGAPVNWTEVVEFKVEKENPTTLYFKNSHGDTSYRSITVKRHFAKFFREPVGPLNPSRVPISKTKYEDLMSMCRGDTAIIRHQEYKDFYINLPHE